jgi:hypothetical protein
MRVSLLFFALFVMGAWSWVSPVQAQDAGRADTGPYIAPSMLPDLGDRPFDADIDRPALPAMDDRGGAYDSYGRRPTDSSDLFLYDEMLDPAWPTVEVLDPDGEPALRDDSYDLDRGALAPDAPVPVQPLPAFIEPGGEPPLPPSLVLGVPGGEPGVGSRPRVAPYIQQALDAARKLAPPPRGVTSFPAPTSSAEAAAAASMPGEVLLSPLEESYDDFGGEPVQEGLDSAPDFGDW